MKTLKTIIILLLTSAMCFGQKNLSDTFLTRDNQSEISMYDEDFLKATRGAELYLKSLLSDTAYEKHIQVNSRKSTKAAFEVRFGDAFNSQVLERHTYFNIHYYLLDKGDTLSFFEVLVDSMGKPTPYDKDFDFSSPTEFLLTFKSLFQNKFKIIFMKAVQLGRQHGFDAKPFLNYVTLDKPEAYWSFSKTYPDRTTKFMDINVETGAIKCFYMPVLNQ